MKNEAIKSFLVSVDVLSTTVAICRTGFCTKVAAPSIARNWDPFVKIVKLVVITSRQFNDGVDKRLCRRRWRRRWRWQRRRHCWQRMMTMMMMIWKLAPKKWKCTKDSKMMPLKKLLSWFWDTWVSQFCCWPDNFAPSDNSYLPKCGDRLLFALFLDSKTKHIFTFI